MMTIIDIMIGHAWTSSVHGHNLTGVHSCISMGEVQLYFGRADQPDSTDDMLTADVVVTPALVRSRLEELPEARGAASPATGPPPQPPSLAAAGGARSNSGGRQRETVPRKSKPSFGTKPTRSSRITQSSISPTLRRANIKKAHVPVFVRPGRKRVPRCKVY